MRTHHRRPLAIAATFTAALLGGGMLAAQPAAAADTTSAAVTDCGTTSVGADGMLDVDLLQACLGRLQSSLTPEMPDAPEPAYETSEPEAADDIVEPGYYEAEYSEVAYVEEAAPVDEGLGGAFAALRDCESGGDYSINTGNGYYGAYQFALSTWEGLGYGGYPHEASPAVQDQAASELQSLYGWGQWPACSWYLGLG